MKYGNMAEDELWDLLDWYRNAAKDKGRTPKQRRQARIEAIHIAEELQGAEYSGDIPTPTELLAHWDATGAR